MKVLFWIQVILLFISLYGTGYFVSGRLGSLTFKAYGKDISWIFSIPFLLGFATPIVLDFIIFYIALKK